MEILGYVAALFVGVSLGLIGGGGSILTVPVLVYLFHVSPLIATSYSLFIVGTTSLVGAVKNYYKGQISIRTSVVFGSSSIVTVFLIRRLVIPLIPKVIFNIGSFEVTQNLLTMLVFAALMLSASFSMISSNGIEAKSSTRKFAIEKIILFGILIGLVTGFLGAGGGFLIIPTLVLIMKLPMKQAIGTSLLIIAFNSLIGFTGDFGHFQLNWPFLLSITALAIIGLFIGNALGAKIKGQRLKKGFGWFVLVMGMCIIFHELFYN